MIAKRQRFLGFNMLTATEITKVYQAPVFVKSPTKAKAKSKKPTGSSPATLNKVRELIESNAGITRQGLVQLSDFSQETIDRALVILIGHKVISKKPIKRAGPHWICAYSLVEK